MAPHRLILTSVAALALTACDQFPDFDLRDLGDGFDTSAAVENLPNRPAPDDRGVISYPNYQVVVAQRDDTIRTIATRLGLDTQEVARFNGIEPDITLRRDELIALPGRVTEPSPATGAATTGPLQPLDITAVATTALDRVDTTPTPAPQASPATPDPGVEPIRHKVERGETVFQISRLYNVPVRNIAEWNGLGPDLVIREGQFLLIPQGGAQPPVPVVAPTEQPGSGSTTPVPPSAATPLPDPTPAAPAPEVVPETPDIGEATPNTSSARLIYPVEGPVIRAYAPGRNEGIDISAAPGTNVRAADGGVVAAVTTNTAGVAIVVVKHPDGLLTVYTNLENLTVSKNDRVAKGDNIGQVPDSEPSFLHFEVRRGLQSVDPADFLP